MFKPRSIKHHWNMATSPNNGVTPFLGYYCEPNAERSPIIALFLFKFSKWCKKGSLKKLKMSSKESIFEPTEGPPRKSLIDNTLLLHHIVSVHIFDIMLNGLMLPVTLQLFEGFGSFRYRFDNIESKHEMVLNSAEKRLYRCFYFEITNNTALKQISVHVLIISKYQLKMRWTGLRDA